MSCKKTGDDEFMAVEATSSTEDFVVVRTVSNFNPNNGKGKDDGDSDAL